MPVGEISGENSPTISGSLSSSASPSTNSQRSLQLLRNLNGAALEKELFSVLEIRSVQIDLVFSFSYTGSVFEKAQRLDKP